MMPTAYRKTNSGPDSPSRDSLMLALEPRLLFDAAGLVTGLDLPAPQECHGLADTDLPDPAALSPEGDAGLSSLIFIDSGVSHPDTLLTEIPENARMVPLSGQGDGVSQIRDVLSRYHGIQAVQIISHGAPGRIFLGNAELSGHTMADHAQALREWGEHLAPGADILIYGCNAAQGIEGQAFVAQLSDITGADVAASDDPTGAAGLGGDWDLETRTGIIEAAPALSHQTCKAYQGILADYTVTQAGDSQDVALNGVDTTDGLTLREAIRLAEKNAEADTISFANTAIGVNTLQYGALVIKSDKGLTINGDSDGDGTYDVTLDGQGSDRIFEITKQNATVTLTGLKITNGYSYDKSSSYVGGGGIFNKGTLKIYNSIICDNKTFSVYEDSCGGGIYNSGTMTIFNSTICDNTCDHMTGSSLYSGDLCGGGIYNNGTMTIYNSTICGNTAYCTDDSVRGVGINNSGTMTIYNSTINNNGLPKIPGFTSTRNAYGIGIYNSGTMAIYNSTIDSNYTEYYSYTNAHGVGIFNSGTLKLNSSTISNNIDVDWGRGSGIWNSGTTTVENSTIYVGSGCGKGDMVGIWNTADLYVYHSTIDTQKAGYSGIYNTSYGTTVIGHSIITKSDSSFTVISKGYNLFQSASVNGNISSDLVGANADLNPLADNGGPTKTLSLGNDSDAFDAGDPSAVAGDDGISATDQRGTGYTRTLGTIDIGAVEMTNRPPDAVADEISTDEITAITGNLLTNDTDPDGDPLSVSTYNISGVAGSITINADGTYSYDPNGQFDTLAVGETATETFTYTISDGNGFTAKATVTIIIAGVNDPPTAQDDAYTTNSDTALTTYNLLDNDSDPNASDTLTVTGYDISGVAGGISINPDGTFTYDPNGQFDSLDTGETATETFTYTVSDGNGGTSTATVTLTVTGINDPPAAQDDTATTDKNAAVTTNNVLTNDTDPEGDTLTVTGMDTSLTKGQVTHNADGTFTYDPNGQFDSLGAGQTATDTFTYTVEDSNAGTDTATVTITITGVNDSPTAQNDAYTTNSDTALTTHNLLDNDSDPNASDTLTVTGYDISGVAGGISINADGTFTYDPNGQFDSLDAGDTATETFTYTVEDGNGGTDTATVTLTVKGINDPPAAQDDTATTDKNAAVTTGNVLANDTDAEGDTLTVTGMDTSLTKGQVTNNGDGTFTYDPNGQFGSLGAGQTATDTFTYTVSDSNGGTDTATVTITVTGINESPPPAENNAPAALPDTGSTDEETTFTTDNVLTNDSDADGDTLTVTGMDTSLTKGQVTHNGNGTFTYDPDGQFDSLGAGETATDTFTYTVSDGNGGTSTATVTITVTGISDSPENSGDAGSQDQGDTGETDPDDTGDIPHYVTPPNVPANNSNIRITDTGFSGYVREEGYSTADGLILGHLLDEDFLPIYGRRTMDDLLNGDTFGQTGTPGDLFRISFGNDDFPDKEDHAQGDSAGEGHAGNDGREEGDSTGGNDMPDTSSEGNSQASQGFSEQIRTEASRFENTRRAFLDLLTSRRMPA